MASSFPPICSRVMRSCSCCFWVRSSLARFSKLRFSSQRVARLQTTASATMERTAREYRNGFLKADFFSGYGLSSMPVLYWSENLQEENSAEWHAEESG